MIKRIYFLILFFMTMPLYASAQSDGASCPTEDTFGTIVNRAIGNSDTVVISTLYSLSAILGLIGVGMGIKSLIESASDSRSSPVTSGLFKIFGGSLLIAFPLIATIIGETVFGADTNSLARSVPSSPMETGSDQLYVSSGIVQGVCNNINSPADSILGMYENFVRDAADPLTKLAYFVAIVMGLYLIITAIQRLMNGSSPTSQYHGKMSQQVARFLVGTIFINVYPLITLLSGTLFKSNFTTTSTLQDNVLLSYNPGGASSALNQFCNINQLLYIGLIPFGLFAVIAGLRSIYLSLEGGQQSTAGGGAVKIVAGIILVNMELFANAVMNTLSPSSELLSQTCGSSGEQAAALFFINNQMIRFSDITDVAYFVLLGA